MGQFLAAEAQNRTTLTFAEVLEQRIRGGILSEKGHFKGVEKTPTAHFPSENPSKSSTSRKSSADGSQFFQEEIINFAWILGHAPRVDGRTNGGNLPRGKTAYGVKTRLRPPHKMNEAQRSAYRDFQSHIPELQSNFTRRDLQRAFRLIAKKLHPDCGGTTKDFIALKANLEVLAALF